ncbi:MAG: cell division protein FtsH [Parcubacteria group bacterium CG11_big_fil_rev_8_21_14_0_20_39_14]|nr:MAG: cell division protein FtsH [Parcubacteria group bacterium CG11_big_fil_rev_8_21_14_0_20_39_14]PIS35348.1 MAG: cell division protein FtsH [Parcubacteria group bacterium CG08_land_8_20_14_0_20_38_56]
MRPFFKNLLFAFLIFLVLASIFSLFASSPKKVEDISLTALVKQINFGDVKSITVRGDNLEIVYIDDNLAKSKKEKEASLSESFQNYGVVPEKLAKVNVEVKEESGWLFWLGNILPFLLPLILIFFFFWLIFRQARHGSMEAFSFGKAKPRLFGAEGNPKDKITFADVAGLYEAKEELKEVVEFLKHSKKFLEIGARIPRGVLLLGAPGTGKTLLARAVAGEANVPFFHISGSEFVEMFVGVGAARVRDLFNTAKKNAPSILFIDEIDAVGRQRGAGLGGGHDEREQTLNQILVQMDGFERETQVIVMAATNRPDILDPALLRPGRFDRRIILDEPDLKSREEILKIHCQGKVLEHTVNLEEIAARTPGFSGADLANLANEAAILAARRDKKSVGQTELLESIEKVLLGPERKSHILSKREKEIAAYHEAGHALVASSLPNADPVQKVSIISRGRAAGYTLKLPLEEKHFRTKSEFLDELAVFFGGYVAEKMIFNEITTGASNDLKEATELARKLIMEYGMSKLGPITFAKEGEMIFLGREISERREYSEEIAFQIDKELISFIKDAEATAKKILIQKRNILEKIAKKLIEKETIEKEEFDKLIKG